MRCSHQCHFVDCFDLIPRTHNKSVDFSMGTDIISSATGSLKARVNFLKATKLHEPVSAICRL